MIYLDYNATTPLCQPAREAMEPYFGRHFGNPSSIHVAGREARAAIDDARDRIAALLHVKPSELIFTSGGTESNNLAILGLARSHAARGRHLICGNTEHHAVLHAFEHVQKGEEFKVTWLGVNEGGCINPDELAQAMRPDTTLVSIMTANNETGVLQPMEEISRLCRARGVLLHSDMVQSLGKLTTKLDDVDAASFAAHKVYGPKGAGLLFLRAGLPIEATQFGGSHENQRRPGTENVPAIAGMAAAIETTMRDQEQEQKRESILRDRLWEVISRNAPDARLNGVTAHRLANTLNISFPGMSSETLLMALDLEGVCASSGSACMVGSVVASHVLLAMGLPPALASSTVRFSLGKETTANEIECAGEAIVRILKRLDQVRAGRQSNAHVAA